MDSELCITYANWVREDMLKLAQSLEWLESELGNASHQQFQNIKQLRVALHDMEKSLEIFKDEEAQPAAASLFNDTKCPEIKMEVEDNELCWPNHAKFANDLPDSSNFVAVDNGKNLDVSHDSCSQNTCPNNENFISCKIESSSTTLENNIKLTKQSTNYRNPAKSTCCPVCNHKFYNRRNLREHINTITTCGSKVTWEELKSQSSSVLVQVVTERNETIELEPVNNSKRQKNLCQTKQRPKYRNSKHNTDCPVCQHKFFDRKNLRRHVKRNKKCGQLVNWEDLKLNESS